MLRLKINILTNQHNRNAGAPHDVSWSKRDAAAKKQQQITSLD